MDSIIVKVSALLVMVQALANGKMDFVTLSTEEAPEEGTGYLRFEAYEKYDPFISYTLSGSIGSASCISAGDNASSPYPLIAYRAINARPQ